MNKWIRLIIKLSKLKREHPEIIDDILASDGNIKEIIEKDEKEIIQSLKDTNEDLIERISVLSEIVDGYEGGNEKEEYHNNKYMKTNINYSRHETDGIYNIDIRNYFQTYDNSIPIMKGESDDVKAYKSLVWVRQHVKYKADKETYGYSEYWAYPYQTIKRGIGDCEDGAILMANIMIRSGIPYWKIRLCAGTVYKKDGSEAGGHAYLTYYCESKDRWVTLDWCFYPTNSLIENRPDYKNEIIYGNGKVWFSWNQRFCFAKSTATDFPKIKIVK